MAAHACNSSTLGDPGMVVHTYNSSYSGGWGRRIAWTWEAEIVGSWDNAIALQPGQQEQNSISRQNKTKQNKTKIWRPYLRMEKARAQGPERPEFGSWLTTYHLGDFVQIAYSHQTTIYLTLKLWIKQYPPHRVVVGIKSKVTNPFKYLLSIC